MSRPGYLAVSRPRRPRYLVLPMTCTAGSRVGWAVFPAGDIRMAVGYTGPLAWWLARYRALRLNLKER